MTISSETTKQTFQGNGVQTVFNYTFLLPTTAQYVLYYTDAAGAIELVSQVNYALTGIGNAAGGTLTYTRGGNPIAANTSLTLVRDVPYTQTTDLNNQGAYYPEVIEAALDRLEMQIQQLRTQVNLAFKAPITNDAVADVPTEADRASGWAYWDADGNLTSTTDEWPGGTANHLEITGDQSLVALPVGNAIDTYSSLILTGETEQDDEREFLASIGFVSNRGAAAASPERDKVALYVGMVAASGTGDAWSLNTVLTMDAGASAYNALGYELDFNNLNGHRGDTPGAGGLAAPVAYGLAVTGVAAYRSTSGLLISGSSNMWNRGITIFQAVQAGIQDWSAADAMLDLRGVYDAGISLVNGSYQVLGGYEQAVNMDYGHAIMVGTDRILGADGTEGAVLGDGAVPVTVYGPQLAPGDDNTTSLGAVGQRWTEVYATNGTINTSDARQKNSIEPMASMTDVLRAIEPVTFKFNSGGATREKIKVRRLMPVYEEVEAEVERTVPDDNGHARVVKTVERTRQRVRDTLPVLDENGLQIIDWTKPMVDKHGRVVRESEPVPRVLHVPRMEMQEVEETRVAQRPGKRPHYGFLASDFKEVFDRLGLGDFGGYVRSEDGIEGLRDHQITALLWQVVRELDQRLQEVEDSV